MRTSFNGFKSALSRGYLQAGVATGTALATMGAQAQATDPIATIMDAVSLDGIVAKVVACALLVVAIALAFKGPILAKRVVKTV